MVYQLFIYKIGNNDGDDEAAAEEREERKRIRKLRSRRDRCKNGAQFTQTLHPDFRKAERFEVKKSLSDIGKWAKKYFFVKLLKSFLLDFDAFRKLV